jgi:hypothetical protein
VRSFEIVLQGLRVQGVWFEDKGHLTVKSAYGRRDIYLDGRDPAVTARELLAELIARQFEANPKQV